MGNSRSRPGWSQQQAERHIGVDASRRLHSYFSRATGTGPLSRKVFTDIIVNDLFPRCPSNLADALFKALCGFPERGGGILALHAAETTIKYREFLVGLVFLLKCREDELTAFLFSIYQTPRKTGLEPSQLLKWSIILSDSGTAPESKQGGTIAMRLPESGKTKNSFESTGGNLLLNVKSLFDGRHRTEQTETGRKHTALVDHELLRLLLPQSEAAGLGCQFSSSVHELINDELSQQSEFRLRPVSYARFHEWASCHPEHPLVRWAGAFRLKLDQLLNSPTSSPLLPGLSPYCTRTAENGGYSLSEMDSWAIHTMDSSKIKIPPETLAWARASKLGQAELEEIFNMAEQRMNSSLQNMGPIGQDPPEVLQRLHENVGLPRCLTKQLQEAIFSPISLPVWANHLSEPIPPMDKSLRSDWEIFLAVGCCFGSGIDLTLDFTYRMFDFAKKGVLSTIDTSIMLQTVAVICFRVGKFFGVVEPLPLRSPRENEECEGDAADETLVLDYWKDILLELPRDLNDTCPLLDLRFWAYHHPVGSSALRTAMLSSLGPLRLKPHQPQFEGELISGMFDRYNPASRVAKGGRHWCLLSGRWWSSWAKFANFFDEMNHGRQDSTQNARMKSQSLKYSTSQSKTLTPSALLGPINNFDILVANSGRLRMDVSIPSDLRPVTDRVWLALHCWHGGGPEVIRKQEKISSSFDQEPPREKYALQLHPLLLHVHLRCEEGTKYESNQNSARIERILQLNFRRDLSVMELHRRLKVFFGMHQLTSLWRGSGPCGEEKWELLCLSRTASQQLYADAASLQSIAGSSSTESSDGNESQKGEATAVQEVNNADRPLTVSERTPDSIHRQIFDGEHLLLEPVSGTHPPLSGVVTEVSFKPTLPQPGLRGLQNMGNTCYINAALQCLSHSPLLKEYFLHDLFLEDLIEGRPSCSESALAKSFAQTIGELWDEDGLHMSVTPREVRDRAAAINPQFGGYQQQDAQEFLALLLSSLGEGLNRGSGKKPYMELPDSSGRPDTEMAALWWYNHTMRENSIITALFTAQFKSLLRCHNCKYESARFEPYMFLQLSIPEVAPEQSVSILLAGQTMSTAWIQINVQVSRPKDAILSVEQAVRCAFESTVGIDRQQNVDKRPIGDLGQYCLITMMENRIDRHLTGKEDLRDVTCHGQRIVLFPIGAQKRLRNAVKTISLKKSRAGLELENRQTDIHNMPPRPHSITGCASVVVVHRRLAISSSYFASSLKPQLFNFPYSMHLPESIQTGRDLYGEVAKQLVGLLTPDEAHRLSAVIDAKGMIQSFKEMYANVDGGTRNNEKVDERDIIFRRWGFRLCLVTFSGISCSRCAWTEACLGCTIIDDGQSCVELHAGECLAVDWSQALLDGAEASRLSRVVEWQCANNLTNGSGPDLHLQDCLEHFTEGEDIVATCGNCTKHEGESSETKQQKTLTLWSLPPILILQLKRFKFDGGRHEKLDHFVKFPLTNLDLGPFLAAAQNEDHNHSIQPTIPFNHSDKLEQGDNPTASDLKYQWEHIANASTESGMYEGASISRSRDDQHSNPCFPWSSASRKCTAYDLFAVVNHSGKLGAGHFTAYARQGDLWFHFDDATCIEVGPAEVLSSTAYLLCYLRKDVQHQSVKAFFPRLAMTHADEVRTGPQRELVLSDDRRESSKAGGQISSAQQGKKRQEGSGQCNIV